MDAGGNQTCSGERDKVSLVDDAPDDEEDSHQAKEEDEAKNGIGRLFRSTSLGNRTGYLKKFFGQKIP